MSKPIHIDDQINADWIKYVSWNYYYRGDDGKPKPVKTFDDFIKLLGLDPNATEKKKVKAIVKWAVNHPSVYALPKPIKTQVRKLLISYLQKTK